MQHETITTQDQLATFCRVLATARQIAFDTEFVSEDTYRPQLCLIQVAVEDRLAVIDPLEVRDLVPFWNAWPAANTRRSCMPDGRRLNSAFRPSAARHGSCLTYRSRRG